MLLLFSSSTVDALSSMRNISTGRGAAPALYAARVNSSGEIVEMFPDVANVGARWALPGGIQNLEITVKPRDRRDAFNRYRYNIGDRIILFDDFIDKPIVGGWIMKGGFDGRSIAYSCGGAWKRHSDIPVTTAPTNTDDTDTYLKDTVLAAVLSGGIDTTNIMSTGVVIGDYAIDTLKGTYPDRIVEDLLRMGDSSGNIIDYWLAERPFLSDMTIQLPAAYLQARSSSSDPDWRITLAHVRQGAQSLARDAWDMRNHATVWYGPSTTLSSDANGGSATIVVASVSDLAAEYGIEILLDSGRFHKTTIDSISGTTVTLVDELPNTGTNPVATSGNLVRVTDPLSSVTVEDTTPQATYWLRKYYESRPTFTAAAATNLATATVSALAYPANEEGFTIGGNWIYDTNGGRWPIWRILTNPGVLEISDLLPDADLLADHLDSLRSFRVVAVDYDHRNRTARIVPDAWNGDQRLDVVLQQLGAQVGQLVNRS